MDKFVKRVQSRLSHSGISLSKSECREAYQAVVAEASWESPSEAQLVEVVEYVKNRGVNNIHQSTTVETTSLAISEPEVSGDELEPIPQPETFDIPVEDMPCLQPPEDSALSTQSAPGAITPGSMAQSEVTDIVGQVFKNQPPEVKNQITEYALQHSFDNVRQLQEFLEQLRSMEFSLMTQTLQDHFSRRGSMLTQLNNLIQGQQQKDQEQRTDFFDRFQNQLNSFHQEMQQRLSKQSL